MDVEAKELEFGYVWGHNHMLLFLQLSADGHDYWPT
jgi:hypothetical protein